MGLRAWKMKLTYLVAGPSYKNIVYFVAIMETCPGILTITQIHTKISLVVYMRIKHLAGACMKNYIS